MFVMDRIEIFSTSALTDLRMMLETKPTMTQEQKDTIVKSFQNDNIMEYKGKISLPV